jgi:predicted metal-dependent hydrolase
MTGVCADLSFGWGDQTIAFSVERCDRETLRISVTPAGEVLVSAPAAATDDDVLKRVRRRGGWILRQVRHFERWRPRTPPRQYLTGETHLYLGRQFRLRIEQSETPDVRLIGDRLVLSTPRPDNLVHRRALLQHWYGLEAHRLFPTRLVSMTEPFLRHGVVPPRLIIRAMSKRWGSFTAQDSLVLNVDLVRASVSCIDYVIAHELAHSLEPDHGDAWRELMNVVMPDWRERKAELEARLL